MKLLLDTHILVALIAFRALQQMLGDIEEGFIVGRHYAASGKRTLGYLSSTSPTAFSIASISFASAG